MDPMIRPNLRGKPRKSSMDQVTVEVEEELMRGDPSTHFLPEPLIVIISPPPPFLAVPGEPVVPWERWWRSFEQYLEAVSKTNLSDSSKCAFLQHCLGREGQRVYATLVQGETSYAAAISTLTIHFSSVHSPQMYRFKFKQRAQRPGESVDQFVSALEELVKPCNYGDFEDEFILDQLIEKTSCIRLRERLLLEQNTLTLSRALIVGKQVEYALGKCASPSDQKVTLEPEGAAPVDDVDRPVQRAVRGGRTRRFEKRKEVKPQETKTASNICGHNKDNDYYYSNDEQYRGEAGGRTDACSDDDGGGVDDTEDEDFDYDDAKDKDYEVGDETDEDRDNNDANDEDDEGGGDDKMSDEDYDDATGKDVDVDGDENVTGSKTKKAYICPICIDRSFRHASKLARHMRLHTKEKPFKCPVCPMAFSQSYHMNRHLRNQHEDHNDTNDKDYDVGDETDEDRDNNDANDEDDEGGGDDKVSDKDYDDATGKDVDVDGDKDVTVSKTPKKAYVCPICIDRSFRHASKLARHMRVHTKEKPFKCPVCPMAFSQSYHMNSHLRNCHDDYNHTKDNDGGGDEMANIDDYDDGAGDEGFSKTQKTEYSCSICTGKSFRHQSKLARHMKTHCKEKTFRCPVCDMTFGKSYHMTKHIKNKHRSGQYICPKCGKSLGSWAELKTHTSTHARSTLEELACPVCNNKFRGKRALAGHIKTHSRARAETRRHTCTVCAKRFNSMYHLRRHMMTIHGIKPECHKCPDCQRSFPHLQDLKNHQEVHGTESISREIEEKSYLCATCGKKFHFQYALRNHERKHKEAPFYCSTCDKHFTELTGYERHQRVHARREFKCPHCERVFLKNFKNHLRTHIKERPYQCSCCVESFTQKEDLELHCLKHKKFKKDKPYLCTRCGYAFSTMEELTAHMGLHKGEEPTTCPECGWTFLNKSKLEQHMSIHTGKGPHLCSYCGNVFSSSTTLKSHVRIHTGERPYKCTTCNKGFTSSSRLSVHSRQHMAVRPSFPCHDCGRTYGRMTELRMHQRYHTGDRPFLCNVCSKGFISKHKLSVHMRIHTGERPYSCSQCEQTFRQIGDRNRHMSKCH